MLGLELVQWRGDTPDERTAAEEHLADLWLQGYRPQASGTSAPNDAGVWYAWTMMVVDEGGRDDE